MFFARLVIICEGASEKTFFEYLIDNLWPDLLSKKIYLLNALGKFNIHRYMNLCDKLGIKHSVIMDSDENKNIQEIFNVYIERNRNPLTNDIYTFEKDFESFLEIPPLKSRKDLKPINILRHYNNGSITENKINELRAIINKL